MGRGIDFKGVNLVINYDFPNSAVSYIHRIGEIYNYDQSTSIRAYHLVAITGTTKMVYTYFDGLVQDCSNSSTLAMELLQSCTKP